VQMAGSSLDPVVVKSSKPGKPAPVQWLGGAYGGSNWNYTHGDVVKWNDQRATVWGRLDAGQLPIVNGDDPELIANSNSYFLEWKARNEWRSMNYLVWDFTTMCIPLPKVGMLRWLKYGGRTFKEAKALIWLKNTRPIFQKIVNEETGQTFKVFAEIHHKYIPQRWNLPNWLTNATWNLQITNSIEHAVMDPYRYQFLPKWVKEGIEAGEISGESVLRVK